MPRWCCPYSTKFLIDTVINKHHIDKLQPLVLFVLGATLVQGVTSFSLTQSLSKAAQRLITELRQQVQVHISRLPVAFYDANKTGSLVSRIMSDVEGVRNLLGTGLVDFAGGLVTSGIALVLLLRTSVQMTLIAVGALVFFGLALNKAFATIRPIFRERGKDQRRGHRAASPNRWAACASSRAITPNSAKRPSLRPAFDACWIT